jgi:hypothetical protein
LTSQGGLTDVGIIVIIVRHLGATKPLILKSPEYRFPPERE